MEKDKKRIEKSNKTADFPVCGEKKVWDHFFLCEKNKNERED